MLRRHGGSGEPEKLVCPLDEPELCDELPELDPTHILVHSPNGDSNEG